MPLAILTEHDPDGHPILGTSPRQGSETIFATHDLCDPTSWYGESIRVTGEAMTDTGDGLTWSVAATNFIDMTHGKVMNEDTYILEVDHEYAIKVYVDSVEMEQRAPFADSGGDYTVDYINGTVTFAVDQSGKTVTIDYSKAVGSCFILEPVEGKVLDIESAEAQFSADVVYNDTIIFEVYGYVIAFAPAMAQSNGGPLADFDLISLTQKKYKTLDQIIDEAMGSYPVIPAMGGGIRGGASPRHGFPFRYGTIRRLYHSLGMQLCVRLEGDTAFGGERATATFYCTSKDEPET